MNEKAIYVLEQEKQYHLEAIERIDKIIALQQKEKGKKGCIKINPEDYPSKFC